MHLAELDKKFSSFESARVFETHDSIICSYSYGIMVCMYEKSFFQFGKGGRGSRKELLATYSMLSIS